MYAHNYRSTALNGKFFFLCIVIVRIRFIQKKIKKEVLYSRVALREVDTGLQKDFLDNLVNIHKNKAQRSPSGQLVCRGVCNKATPKRLNRFLSSFMYISGRSQNRPTSIFVGYYFFILSNVIIFHSIIVVNYYHCKEEESLK